MPGTFAAMFWTAARRAGGAPGSIAGVSAHKFPVARPRPLSEKTAKKSATLLDGAAAPIISVEAIRRPAMMNHRRVRMESAPRRINESDQYPAAVETMAKPQ